MKIHSGTQIFIVQKVESNHSTSNTTATARSRQPDGVNLDGFAGRLHSIQDQASDGKVDLQRIARIGHRISIGGLWSQDVLFTQCKDGHCGQKQDKAA